MKCTHPRVVVNQQEALCSVEHNRYFEECYKQLMEKNTMEVNGLATHILQNSFLYVFHVFSELFL